MGVTSLGHSFAFVESEVVPEFKVTSRSLFLRTSLLFGVAIGVTSAARPPAFVEHVLVLCGWRAREEAQGVSREEIQ